MGEVPGALTGPRFGGYDIRAADVPAYDAETVGRCMELCRGNVCGKYGTCWACPPGMDTHMDTFSQKYDSALLISRTWACDPRDMAAVEGFNSEIRAAVRDAVALMRDAGYECTGLCDGGCDICPRCAYPEPCRFPDRVLPSVSAVGIDMGEYLGSQGEAFSFRDDAVTFYGIVLYRARPGLRAHNGYNKRPG